MENNIKSSKKEAEISEASFCPVAYATLFHKGLERVVAVSRTSLDSAVEQNSEVLASYKQALKASSRHGLFLVDLASQAFEGHVTLQKSLLDLAAERRTAVAEPAQDHLHDPSQAKAGISNLIQPSADRTVTAQRSVVVFRRTPPTPRIRAAS
jgi:hypothetical protein